MLKDKLLVIGANDSLGAELTCSLREIYGSTNVVAAGMHHPDVMLRARGPYEQINVLQPVALNHIIQLHRITQIYLLDGVLHPNTSTDMRSIWDIQIKSLLNVLEAANTHKVRKVFWPSHVVVCGQNISSAECLQVPSTGALTMYRMAKLSGELWCRWFNHHHDMDVRSLRFPGVISYIPDLVPSISDFAMEMFHAAVKHEPYSCDIKDSTRIPMLYMPDALRAIMQLMEAPSANIRIRTSYNVAGMNITPAELSAQIKIHQPMLNVHYPTDKRQCSAELWPEVLSDDAARLDFGWQADYDIETMTISMLENVRKLYRAPLVE